MSLKLSNIYNLWEQILNYIMNFPSRDTYKQTKTNNKARLLGLVRSRYTAQTTKPNN